MKNRSDSYYPDVLAAGTLASLIQAKLQENGHFLNVLTEGPLFSAEVQSQGTSSILSTSSEERSFHCSCYRLGVLYASGWAPTLTDLLKCLELFHVEQAACAILGHQFPWLKIEPLASVHEFGPGAFVEAKWEALLSSPRLRDSPLGSLVKACALQPSLRKLLPLLSHNRLCFSRTTGWPYSADCNCVTFSAITGDCYVQDRQDEPICNLASGTADYCATFLALSLPDDYGPATHGFSE